MTPKGFSEVSWYFRGCVCVCVKVSFQGMEGFCSILYYLDPLKLHVKLA